MRMRTRVALSVAMTLPLVATTLVLTSGPAQAHGAMTFPSTRTHVCFKEDPQSPDSQVCKDAIAQGGTQPLYDWFGLLIGNAAGRHREIIPDGQLCGAGTAKYAAYNMARADWPATRLKSGATITFRYNAWAPHPGTWSQYVTKDGFDVTQPLKWSDLEPAPFNEVTNPPKDGTSADGAEYTWQGRLPAKSGRHIIYSIWQRSDSPEAFYNCSDVVFDGSGGQVDPPPPTVAPPTSRPPTASPTVVPTTAPTSTAPPTTAPTTAAPTTAAPPVGDGGCTAVVDTHARWPGGFLAQVTVTHAGATPVAPWTVSWTMPTGTTVQNGWNAEVSDDGGRVRADAPHWRRSLGAGERASIGFVGQGTAAGAPTDVRLNGVPCR